MGFFDGKPAKRIDDDTETQTSEPIHDQQYDHDRGLDEEAQEVMAENLDLMKDIVMRIREDPDFASSIYKDCPRLQHLLDDRPDLRPIFEDPYLVRINFEQVYRAAGGKLPEDEEQDDRLGFVKKALVKFVNSPFFKFLRAILLIKKIYSCATGNGFSALRNMLTRCGCDGMLCCTPDVDAPDLADAANNADAADAADADAEADYVGNPQNAELRAALYAAADHMEDPEVAEQMSDLLENDPEALQEAIENDPDLRALRDSSPLCAELMSDPDTMRVLVDPDNLRALGDCPDLIEQDFADPNWTPPDVESGLDNPAYTDTTDHIPVDTDGDGIPDSEDIDADGDGITDEVNAEDVEEEEGPEFELGEKEESGGNDQANKSKPKSSQSQKNKQKKGEGGGVGGGFLSQVTAGLTDMIAGEIVGTTYDEIMGGGDDLGGLESAADEADQAGSAAESAGAVATAASMVPSDELAQISEQADAVGSQLDQLESGMDKLEEAADDAGTNGDNSNQAGPAATKGQIAGSAAESTIVFGPCLLPGDGEKSEQRSSTDVKSTSDDETDDVPEKKSRFGFISDLAGSIGGAAKETMLGAVLGDDLAAWAIEKEEERKAENEEKEKEQRDQSVNRP